MINRVKVLMRQAPAFVINLDRAVERLSFIESQLSGIGIQFDRIQAVDGGESNLQDGSFIDTFAGRPLTSGEIGCFESHRLCWRKLIDCGAPYAYVFEDDVVYSRDFPEFYRRVDWLPERFDLIKLDTFTLSDRIIIGSTKRALGRSLHKSRRFQAGAAAYVISRECAKSLVCLPTTTRLDYLLFGREPIKQRKLHVYQLNPAICIQRMLFSGNRESSLSNYDSELVKPSERLRHVLRSAVIPWLFKYVQFK